MSVESLGNNDDYLRSLTGEDESKIRNAFGVSVVKLAQEDKSTYLRALVFVARRRAGAADPYQDVMRMTLGEVQDHFDDTRAGDGSGEAI